MLHQLLYVSVQTEQLADQELHALLRQSRIKNSGLGITGILIYYKRHFFQVLEGDKEKIFRLFQEIRKDQRHASVILVFDQPVEERSFSDWTMAFLNLNQVDESRLEGFSEFLHKGFTTELTARHLTVAQQLLYEFKDSLDAGPKQKTN